MEGRKEKPLKRVGQGLDGHCCIQGPHDPSAMTLNLGISSGRRAPSTRRINAKFHTSQLQHQFAMLNYAANNCRIWMSSS